MNKICVVGGGTAGSIVASTLVNYYKNENLEITVVASKEVGKIGVGESTTPAFFDFLRHNNISPVDIIKNCNATIKNGIRFENWQGNNDCYWNNFNSGGVIDGEFTTVSPSNSIYKIFNILELHEFITDNWSGGSNHSFELDELNKIPFVRNNNNVIVPASSFAMHIDAQTFSEHVFSKISNQITYIDKKITTVETDNTGISKIVLEDGKTIEADFWIDCSGLSRLLINSLEAEWESFSEDLIINSAMVGNISVNSLDKSPVTVASAMNNGWCWQIPLQSRYGTGYVFNDELTSDAEIEQELKSFVKSKYNSPVENIRKISFKSGCLKNNWIKNCVAIGLSSGFIEPLESTNIHTICVQITQLLYHLPLDNHTNPARKIYNKKIYELQKQIKIIIKLHYLGGRSDTEFWKKMQLCSDEMSEDIEILKNSWITEWNSSWDRNQNTGTKMFVIQNIQPIVLGLNLLNKDVAKNFYNSHIKRFGLEKQNLNDLIIQKKAIEQAFITHQELLSDIIRSK